MKILYPLARIKKFRTAVFASAIAIATTVFPRFASATDTVYSFDAITGTTAAGGQLVFKGSTLVAAEFQPGLIFTLISPPGWQLESTTLGYSPALYVNADVAWHSPFQNENIPVLNMYLDG